ncbi:MAG: hypothetical protein A2Y03_01455 [Omnitrophica WOR_2 bacterium GWF2_38_59]|nr:MAG: hypothetical protein A2Y06_06355 [Omnitrophica WOR_2 bacterium GWA2_37_7]OGX22973.1 MAG: hypothetical protein A2Y03_01455 [Omnitrophica WOR_2 bacterium GWF2_38_59]OGX49715.1 MAG: hypothetical protein A2243_10800 [Omnitrophica WOR_2 bacterium RIFOXYA2_FULL_38_17]OGX52523.1 MAG: hypothetical protein A2267_05075 [Omnitrophica WOR_2 bacterium RIFOXYA12_FULL_38_10]OGX55692.1 MAG: hypothetical protein A2447_11485 [Omnitrophica WOR_2 bacterium RIFOXYC2_FULL_38_12]OGX60140.1 MAG: hypothetical 
MVKKGLLVILAMILVGCSYQGQKLSSYFENPRSIIKDPHFTSYKEKRDALESQYLQRDITYADYVQGMDELDESYAKEVQERDAKISYK